MYYGCKKEIDDKRDYKSYIYSEKTNKYPDKYEIIMPEVKDQGIVNSCVAHSLATFLEETYKQEQIQFSTGFIYGYRPDNYDQGEGMYPREALKTLQKIGDVPKYAFEYNREMPEIKKLVNENLISLTIIAKMYKIDSYSRIYTEDEIKKCIFNDIPVPISIPVYNNLDYDKDTFIIKEPKGKLDGYHMMIIYGYDENGWLIQNSWGTSWGNNGKAILPYKYILDTAWAIDTQNNSVITYTTIWQKIYTLLIKVINRLKTYFHI